MSTKRILKELSDFESNPFSECCAGPVGDDIHKWQATITGPAGTPYENGLFFLDVVFPINYPFSAPKIQFTTKIYHPNINNTGCICLEILTDKWSPNLTLRQLLLSFLTILGNPSADDPAMPEIAMVYKNDKALFNKTAAEWTRKYAAT